MVTRRLAGRIEALPFLLSSPRQFHYYPQFRTMATSHLNRLATAKSPYLRQHATNPVDWYPFEKAALDRAKAENKVLQSMCTDKRGYSCRLDIAHVTGTLPPPRNLLTTGP